MSRPGCRSLSRPGPPPPELLEWSNPAAEEPVRAGAVGNADAVLGEKLDLLGVGVDAVRGRQTGAEQARRGQQSDPGLAGRWHEE